MADRTVVGFGARTPRLAEESGIEMVVIFCCIVQVTDFVLCCVRLVHEGPAWSVRCRREASPDMADSCIIRGFLSPLMVSSNLLVAFHWVGSMQQPT